MRGAAEEAEGRLNPPWGAAGAGARSPSARVCGRSWKDAASTPAARVRSQAAGKDGRVPGGGRAHGPATPSRRAPAPNPPGLGSGTLAPKPGASRLSPLCRRPAPGAGSRRVAPPGLPAPPQPSRRSRPRPCPAPSRRRRAVRTGSRPGRGSVRPSVRGSPAALGLQRRRRPPGPARPGPTLGSTQTPPGAPAPAPRPAGRGRTPPPGPQLSSLAGKRFVSLQGTGHGGRRLRWVLTAKSARCPEAAQGWSRRSGRRSAALRTPARARRTATRRPRRPPPPSLRGGNGGGTSCQPGARPFPCPAL